MRDPTFLGTVQDVAGSTIRIALDEHTLSGLTFIEGHGYRVGQVGAFVRIPLGYVDLFGIVSQVGAGAAPDRLLAQMPHGDRWMTVQLAGQAGRNSKFERGVSQYPVIGDPTHIVTENDLRRIYGQQNSPSYVNIGVLAASSSIPALLDLNKLVTRHCAVLGTTGSGKSTTVAGIISAVSDTERYPSARILMIDVHGEYARALRDRASVFRIGANARLNEKELYVPYWALTFDEFISVATGGIDDPAARVSFVDKIIELKREALAKNSTQGVDVASLTVDAPVPFSIRRLWWDFHTKMRATHREDGNPQSQQNWALELDEQQQPIQPGNLEKIIPPRFRPPKDDKNDSEKIRLSNSRLNAGRQTDILGGRLRDQRLSFLFTPGEWDCNEAGECAADLDSLLEGWIGSQAPVTILDLSGVPPTIQSELVGALLRILFEALFWGRAMPEGGRSRPLLVVLEEAHSYLAESSGSTAKLAVQRIAKEGRKYGMGLMIVSQRPSEIDTTILSQCGTLIALRLSNSIDRNHIISSVTDNLDGLFASLPILRTGEAIIVGEAVNLPIRTLISPPAKGRAPDSQDPQVVHPDDDDGENVGGWTEPMSIPDYSILVEAWRRQNARSLRAEATELTERSMDWMGVTSSNITAIAYDQQSQTLSVEFKAGTVYHYFDVPRDTFDEFYVASSKGQFLHKYIKSQFRYERG